MTKIVSIIIPVKEINDYIREAMPHILKLNNKDFEILIFSDTDSGEQWENTRIIETGHIGPAEKRDLAMKHAKGNIYAFLDDDSYPKKDWLDEALKTLKEKNVVAVGGPAITPKHDSFWQKVSGAVFLSKLSGGNPERYWPIGKMHEVDDWPSVNLVVKKEAFCKVGGFDSQYWPGEDTKLCLDLLTQTGGKILYNPKMLVYHHRRAGFFKHLKQIGNYGLHRGFFAKTFPKTSRKLLYFIPSLFLVFMLFGWIALFINPIFKSLYILGWMLYILALGKAFIDIILIEKNVLIAFAALYYIFFTHLWYGWRFIKGFLFVKKLQSRLR